MFKKHKDQDDWNLVFKEKRPGEEIRESRQNGKDQLPEGHVGCGKEFGFYPKSERRLLMSVD